MHRNLRPIIQHEKLHVIRHACFRQCCSGSFILMFRLNHMRGHVLATQWLQQKYGFGLTSSSGVDFYILVVPWWRHQMETFSALLALCAGNSPVTGEFPPQSPVTRNFDVFFDLRLNKRLSKQSWCWWFETPSGSLWRHCDAYSWRVVAQCFIL